MKSIILLLIVMGVVGAYADVGVLVEFPDGSIYTKCVAIEDGKSAYSALSKTDLNDVWTNDGQWGRGLCKINDVGSDPNGDVCSDWNSYWAFSLALNEDSDWTSHSPVGFTLGSCWNRDYQTPSYDGHYCTKHGDVLGFHYTSTFPSGYPDFEEFEDICIPEKKGPVEKMLLMSSRPYYKQYAENCGIEYTDRISAQALRLKCKEHKERTNIANESIALENMTVSLNETNDLVIVPTTIIPQEDKIIDYSFSPEIITSFDEEFNLFFSSDGNHLGGITVTVNGQELLTDSLGQISFNVRPGDYLVSFNLPGYKEFKTIFRISG